MQAVLKNLCSAVELLAVSQTEFVREWDAQSVDRAFQWARYCEHVYSRFYSNPSVRPVLEEGLRQTNERICEAFSEEHRPVSLADVAHCRHRLFITLLRNPATPYSVIKSLLDRYRLIENDGDPEQGRESDSDLVGLISCKSACKLIGVFPLESSGLATDTQVQGLMLLQRLHSIQCRPGNDTLTKTLLDAVLQDSGGVDQLSKVLTASLLIKDSTGEDTGAQIFILDWLQGRQDLHQDMCRSLPAQLCTRLCQQWPNFRSIYWGVLKKWASSLEYEVNEGAWIQQCDSGNSFKTLLDRFKSLLDSDSLLKEETEKELGALKQKDGDFDVQGLSVWTDLLILLK